jgi:hypothetical protein
LKWTYTWYGVGGTPITQNDYFESSKGGSYFTTYDPQEQINDFRIDVNHQIAKTFALRGGIDSDSSRYQQYLQHLQEIDSNPISYSYIGVRLREKFSWQAKLYYKRKNDGLLIQTIPLNLAQFSFQEGACPEFSKIKGISASANQYNYRAYKAVDGDASTYWFGKTSSSAAALTLNLQKTYSLGELKINWYYASGYQSQSYDIQVSNDGQNFSTAIANLSATRSGIDLEGLSAKYVRLVFRSAPYGYAVVNEVSVTGK